MTTASNSDSHSAISSWLDDFGDDMYSWAYYKTSSRETAEDLVKIVCSQHTSLLTSTSQGATPKLGYLLS